MSISKSTVWAVGLVLALASLGHANLVTVDITGVWGPTGENVVTGSYTYDDVPFYTFPEIIHLYSILNWNLDFGDGTLSGDGPDGALTHGGGSLSLYNGPGIKDRYIACAMEVVGTGVFAGFAHYPSVEMTFTDFSGTALDTSLILPDPEDVLDLFPSQYAVVDDWSTSVPVHFRHFTITDLSVAPTPVPVPGAVVLGLIGLACTSWLGRRKGL